MTLHVAIAGIDIESPVLNIRPLPLSGKVSTYGDKGTFKCERVCVSGLSRLKLGSYASSFRVSLAPSADIPERFRNKIHVCFHR